jgi:antitoxin component of MazEF toxin-antitoxin module
MTALQRFRAPLLPAGGGGHAVRVPARVVTALGGKPRQRVKGTVNGVPYRSNVAPYGGTAYLGVHKAVVQAAAVRPGDTVTVTIAADAASRPRSRRKPA